MSDGKISDSTAEKNDWLVIGEPACVYSGIGLFCLTVLKKKIANTKKFISSFILMSDGIDKNYDLKIFDSVFHFVEIPDSDKVRLKNIYC